MNIEIRFGQELPEEKPKNIRTNAEEIAETLTAEDTISRAGPHRVSANTTPSSIVSKTSLGRIRAESSSPSQQHSEAGRNDPCPCGSGRKHKKCCGKRRIDTPQL